MDKKEWKIIDDLKGKVQQISEQQNMQKKLAHVKYVAVEFAYDHLKMVKIWLTMHLDMDTK